MIQSKSFRAGFFIENSFSRTLVEVSIRDLFDATQGFSKEVIEEQKEIAVVMSTHDVQKKTKELFQQNRV